ncbi:hypothetical protein BDQ17DRAFT_1242026, partial [Cyathus striatus]
MTALRSNRVPTTFERTTLLSTIDKVDSDVSRLDEQIAILQQRRKKLFNFVTRQQSLLAPVRKLPDELLRVIFLLCRQSSEDEGSINVCRPDRFGRTITQICSYWRVIANSSPLLW